MHHYPPPYANLLQKRVNAGMIMRLLPVGVGAEREKFGEAVYSFCKAKGKPWRLPHQAYGPCSIALPRRHAGQLRKHFADRPLCPLLLPASSPAAFLLDRVERLSSGWLWVGGVRR